MCIVKFFEFNKTANTESVYGQLANLSEIKGTCRNTRFVCILCWIGGKKEEKKVVYYCFVCQTKR